MNWIEKNGMHAGKSIVQWTVLLSALAGSVLTLTWAYLGRQASYDDEGYILLSMKGIAEGGIPYGEVETLYGPLFYYLQMPILALGGLSVSHDFGRLVTLGCLGVFLVAMAAALIRGGGTFSLAAILTIVLTLLITLFSQESYHPQYMLLSCLGLLLWLLAGARKAWEYFLAGVLVGAMLCIKVNAGLLTLAALLLMMAWGLTQPRFLRAGYWAGVAFALALPTVLIWRSTSIPGLSHDIVIYTSLIVACLPAILRHKRESVSDWKTMTTGGAGVLAVILVVMLIFWMLHGDLAPLLEGMLKRPMELTNSFIRPRFTGPDALYLALPVISLLLYFFTRSTHFWSWGFAVLATLPGPILAVGLEVYAGTSLSNLVAPFAWLLIGINHLLPRELSRQEGAFRVFVMWFTLLFQLYTFPVPGVQIYISYIGPLLLMAILLKDGLDIFTAKLPQPWSKATSLLIPALAIFGIATIFGRAHGSWNHYKGGVPIAVAKGADLIRLHLPSAAANNALLLNSRYSGRYPVHAPELASIYLMSGIQPRHYKTQTNWPFAFDAAMQQNQLRKLQPTDDLLILENPALMREWAGSVTAKPGPMIDFVEQAPPIAYLPWFHLPGWFMKSSSATTPPFFGFYIVHPVSHTKQRYTEEAWLQEPVSANIYTWYWDVIAQTSGNFSVYLRLPEDFGHIKDFEILYSPAFSGQPYESLAAEDVSWEVSPVSMATWSSHAPLPIKLTRQEVMRVRVSLPEHTDMNKMVVLFLADLVDHPDPLALPLAVLSPKAAPAAVQEAEAQENSP